MKTKKESKCDEDDPTLQTTYECCKEDPKSFNISFRDHLTVVWTIWISSIYYFLHKIGQKILKHPFLTIIMCIFLGFNCYFCNNLLIASSQNHQIDLATSPFRSADRTNLLAIQNGTEACLVNLQQLSFDCDMLISNMSTLLTVANAIGNGTITDETTLTVLYMVYHLTLSAIDNSIISYHDHKLKTRDDLIFFNVITLLSLVYPLWSKISGDDEKDNRMYE